METSDERPVCSATLPARLSAAEREGLLYRAGKRRRERERMDFQPCERDLDSIGRKDERPVLWIVRSSCPCCPPTTLRAS